MWPLYVAGEESGRYFWTARAVNLGHVENVLLLMISVGFALVD